MKKIISLLLVLVLCVAVLSGCTTNSKKTVSSGSSSEATVDTGKIAAIKKSGKLVMYTNAEFAPYEFIKDGNVVGVDVEIGKAIAAKLGVTLEIKQTNFDGVISSIASGKGDVALSGITINDERKKQVNFSVPYVNSVQYLIVPENSSIAYMEDLAGKKIGAQTGTTGEMLVSGQIEKGVLKGKKAAVKQYSSAPVAMQDLKNGRIDAVVIDELVAKQIASQNKGYKAISFKYKSGNLVTEQFGVAIAKGNEDLLTVINEVVQGMVNEGKIKSLIEQFDAK